MAVPRNSKSLGVIGSISKFAGALVGPAVATGKQIIGSATPPDKGRRTSRTRLKKATTPRKKPTRRKAKGINKNKVPSQSQNDPASNTGAGTPAEEQKSQS